MKLVTLSLQPPHGFPFRLSICYASSLFLFPSLQQLVHSAQAKLCSCWVSWGCWCTCYQDCWFYAASSTPRWSYRLNLLIALYSPVQQHRYSRYAPSHGYCSSSPLSVPISDFGLGPALTLVYDLAASVICLCLVASCLFHPSLSSTWQFGFIVISTDALWLIKLPFYPLVPSLPYESMTATSPTHSIWLLPFLNS